MRKESIQRGTYCLGLWDRATAGESRLAGRYAAGRESRRHERLDDFQRGGA